MNRWFIHNHKKWKEISFRFLRLYFIIVNLQENKKMNQNNLWPENILKQNVR